MNEITTRLPFCEKDIDKSSFTASLLANCSANGLLTPEKEADIKNAITALFLESLEEFTSRASGSVSMKYAESIYESVLYRADVYFSHTKSLEEAVQKLIECDFREILAEGSRLLLRDLSQTADYYEKAASCALRVSAPEYNYAVNEAFREFSQHYSARFFAKSTVTQIDYPLLYGPAYAIPETGVLFMKRYYRSLMLENRFCALFPSRELHELFLRYGELCHAHYGDLLFNFCELVCNQFLARALLGKTGLGVRLCEKDCDALIARFRYSTEDDIKKAVRDAFGRFYRVIRDHSVILYLRPYTEQFAHQLCEHLRQGTVTSFLVTAHAPSASE